MANVRLLRQSIADYQKDVAKANDTYATDYANYSNEFERQSKEVDAYNAALAAFNATPTSKHYYSNRDWYMARATANYEADSRYSAKQIAAIRAEYPLPPTPPSVLTNPAPEPERVDPKEPNITASNIREVMNPGLNQAQGQLLQAKGIVAKSDLAGDQPAMKNSVFSDQQDPQGLKERGVLARVLGGQL